MAVFVEGQTEQIFVARLIGEIAGAHAVAIDERQVTGRKGSQPKWIRIHASKPSAGHKYFVLIVDCSGESRVKSEIADNYDSLVSSGYTAIVGVRDVFPGFSRNDIPRLRNGLDRGLRTNPVRVRFALGIMEVETWFISEYTHFLRLSPLLTCSYISRTLGFDPSVDDIQLRDNPAADLHSVYHLAGFAYKKDKRRAQRTVRLLDYASLYLYVIGRVPDLETLIKSIDAFLA